MYSKCQSNLPLNPNLIRSVYVGLHLYTDNTEKDITETDKQTEKDTTDFAENEHYREWGEALPSISFMYWHSQ